MSGHKWSSGPKNAYQELNIEHTTYDQTHRDRMPLRQKETKSHSRERPITQWPGDYLIPPRPPKPWSQRARIDDNINKAAEQLERPSPIHRKSHFENFKDMFRQKSSEGKKEQYIDLRAAIQAGKMEQVVPPQNSQKPGRKDAVPNRKENIPHPSTFHNAPRSLSHNALRSSTSHNTSRLRTSQDIDHERHSQTRRIHSSSGRIGDMIENFGNGVDVVAETRREFQSKFAEKTRFPLSKKEQGRSMEFICVGVDDKIIEGQEKVRREKEDPSVEKAYLGYCRLCKKPMVANVRGLCKQCEKDFKRPRSPETRNKGATGLEIKPTPPLKDKKYTQVRKEKAIPRSRFSFEDDDDDEDSRSLRPSIPLKDNECIKLGDSNSKGRAALQAVLFRESFKAQIENDHTRFTRQGKGVIPLETANKACKQKPRHMPRIKATGQDDCVSLIQKEEGHRQSSRDTNFYGFYDEVINDYSRSLT